MRVNEIFYSLQGEGRWTGTPAVFLRLSGCNLQCPFCDTRHHAHQQMSEEQAVRLCAAFPARHIVVTGGEPALQLTPSLVDRLHREGFFVQVETNGTLPLPPGVDWVTCSPKDAPCAIGHVDELKVLYWGQDVTAHETRRDCHLRLQPLDTGDAPRNARIIQQTVEYIKEHPIWTLSLQTHKILNVR